MIETHLSIFDAVVFSILIASCVFAFLRGFVHEVLSLGAWIGAAIVTLYYFPTAAAKLQPYFKTPVVAAGFATLGLYLAALMAFTIFNLIVLKFLKSGDEIGPIDNIMGLLFGLARGVFIVLLGFFLVSIAMPEKEYPDWLKTSVTLPYVEKGAAALASVAPEYMKDFTTLQNKLSENSDGKNEGLKNLWNREGEDKHGDTGYSKESMRLIDKILENPEGDEE